MTQRQRVWKYQLMGAQEMISFCGAVGACAVLDVPVPTGAVFVEAGMQDGSPKAWMRVADDPALAITSKRFYLAHTGALIPGDCRHLATLFHGPFVFHLFEGIQV